MKDFGSDKKNVVQANLDAQKIAFAPIMFQAAKSLRNLGILEYLFDNNQASIETIAAALKLSIYGVKVLLEAGLSLEMVYLKDNEFILTKTGYFILRDKMTNINMDFTQDVNYLAINHLEASIVNGKPEGLKELGDWDTVYIGLSELPEKIKKSWFDFDHFYSDYTFPEIMPILFGNNPKSFLDVGGNTGKFSMQCANYDANVNITILDLPGQANVARKNIAAAGFQNRITAIDTNLLDNSIPFPKGYDIIWMSQFIDCFSLEEIYGLFRRAYESMTDDASFYILETFWDLQKFQASTYSLHATSLYFTAVANGNSQMFHSQDILNVIAKAGFEVDEIHEIIGMSHTLIKCKKIKQS
ncbi:class I SAM-dependent methyltransferase [Flavobacterium muglaense]|uniref:Class I SAM-dependent methyltransferase n=1 Tax=Flavobacterium muglaense TaxID=2764716 RepID=A0A923MX20_9FLAO|nr:class I SAM-dependent methyltransferase [Flavobacterium muglaense]MBC5837365.1 class I SAM-dependent methyltransferase [Flavobacterium muglaense]MBC5843903.1 class I SAM-dependent methyltransferase [Flavobacterium muglaense]